jgi:hypothetical protein
MLALRFTAALAVLSAAVASAQTTPAPANQKFTFIETVIRPEARASYGDTLKAFCAAIVKGGAKTCHVSSTAMFGDLDKFVILIPLDHYAHFDEGTYFSKGASAEEQKRINGERARAEVSANESTVNLIGSLSLDSNKEPHFMHVTEIQVRPGMQQGFYDDVEKMELPAAKKAGLTDFWVYKTLQGGSPDRMFIVTPFDKFADMDKGNPLFAAMGKENFASFQQHTAAYTEKVSYSVAVYRKDLSASAAK